MFNQDVRAWDVSKVTSFVSMFNAANAWLARYVNCGFDSSASACSEVSPGTFVASAGAVGGPPAGVDPRGRQLRRGVHRRRERGDVHRRATAGLDVRPRVRRGRLDFGRGAPLRWLGQFVSRDVRVRRLRRHRERRSRTDVLVDARDWIVVRSDVRRGVRVIGVEVVRELFPRRRRRSRTTRRACPARATRPPLPPTAPWATARAHSRAGRRVSRRVIPGT